MSNICVYLIIDLISEKVIHTFYAPNYRFAAMKFGEFLDTLKGRSTPSDFALQYVDTVVSPETFDDALKLNRAEEGHEFESGVDVLRYLDEETESEGEN